MRIVDLSVPLSVRCQERGKDSTIPQIEYVDHKWGGQQMAKIFDCSPEDFPIPGCGWAFEIITCGTHNGTHHRQPRLADDADHRHQQSVVAVPIPEQPRRLDTRND